MKAFKYLAFILLFIFNVTLISAQENQDKTPEFTGYHFLYKNNKKIPKGTKIKVDEKYIFLVIETKNAHGEKVTINLDEDEGDYLYKGKYLTTKNGIHFKVKKDAQRIKLVIYNSSIKRHKRLREKAEKELLQ